MSKLVIIQPRLSYYIGGGELMPMDMIKELSKKESFENITILTTKPLIKYSEQYISFKNSILVFSNINIIEMEIPKKFHYIYNTYPGVDRSRWDNESLMFIRLISESELNLNEFTHALSFYILDGISIPSKVKNILYLLGYPKEENNLRSPLLNNYDLLIANSNSVIDNWKKDMSLKQYKNTKLLMQGLVMQELNKADIFKYDNDYRNIVFSGRLIERKGLIDLIEAVDILIKEGQSIKLHIYGEGILEKVIKNKIQKLNLENQIILYGQQNNIPYRLADADMCCFPSHSNEGLMSSVLEGMYYNGLVITTTNNGSESVIKDKVSGFFVEPKDIQSLAEKIKEVLGLGNASKTKIKKKCKKINRNQL
jgi:glycosyltransferase involved in cell wall biosynthesis